MDRQLITGQGHNRLKEDLLRLRHVEMPANITAIEEARAHGDLSENAEFHAAKERQAIINSKINEIEIILAEVEVVDPLPDPQGRVIFGARVLIYDVDTEEEREFQIVGAAESDANEGRISMTSPIGRALIGQEEGNEVQVKTPGGVRILEVVEVNPA